MKAFANSLLMIGLFFMVSSCKDKPNAEKQIKDDVIPVRIQTLIQGKMGSAISVAGQFTTDDETILSFKTGGIIDRILVKEGDPVKKGQLLATLHMTEINAVSQQATLAYQKAQRDYERAARLFKDSVATLEQMQNTKTALDIAKQQLESAQFNRNYSEIRALSNGYILKKFVNEGQAAAPGTPILQSNGANANNWTFKAGVSDRQWSEISEGDIATIETDAFQDKTINAIVSKKSEGIDPQSGTFMIQFKINNAPSGLASGLFGKATLTPSNNKKSWTIPYSAVLDGNNKEGYVFITNDNKTARKIKVTIHSIQNGGVIISDGLQNVQSIIVSGSAYLDDGSAIKVIQ